MDLLQAIKRDVRITEFAQSHGYTLLRVGREFTLKEHDSVRIDPDKNLFYRFADPKARGSIIDFAMWIEDIPMPKAIQGLRTQLRYGPGYVPRPSIPTKPPERRELELPAPTQGKYNRVYAYLGKTRCIDTAVIAAMMRRRMLYEDERHNCVFVGLDRDGKPGFAAKRSTITGSSYRGDATGSRKEVGFFVDNKAPTLFVTEAPIDAMSIMSLFRANGREADDFSYLALGGVHEKALVYHLSRPENAGIRRVYLATDNDEAGDAARLQLRQALDRIGFRGEVIDKAPKGKDWNDDLVALRDPGREDRREQRPKLGGEQAQQKLECKFCTEERGIEP